MTKENGRNNVSRRQKSSKSVLVLLIGFLFGYLGASVFDLTSLQNWINTQFQYQTPKPKPVTSNNEELPKAKFEFYTLLTHDQNQVASNPPAPPTPPPVSQPKPIEINKPQNTVPAQVSIPKGSYFLQVGSFKNQQEAERIKAALSLKGFVVNLSQVVQQQTTWYRVMIGPFSSMSEVQAAQSTVAKSEHITGMIRKINT